ncbi:FAD-binding oxidoreductase [Stappia sediminis]|nr:FAD-binding oxidoreductase [Stappia sediminis]
MARLEPGSLDALRGRFQGQVLLPADDGYDEARTVWNAAVDKRPALILRCADADDVAEAVKFARSRGLLVSVRCGGHNAAGKAVADKGIMIDLTLMNRVEVDPAIKIAVVGGGARLGDFDRAAQEHGLATTAGVVTHTGVGGLTLGGGVGILARKYGLACDNLLSIDLVTAEGERLVASEDENPDLFWALRGGGGNFGIATAFRFRLHEIGRKAWFAAATHPLEKSFGVLKFLMDYAPSAPREVASKAVFATAEDGARVVTIGATHVAPVENVPTVLRPVVEHGSPLVTRLEERPYLDIQSDADLRFPYGQHYYWKTHLIRALPDEVLDVLIGCFARVPNHRSMIILQQFGGAVADVATDATAFANRDAEFDFIPTAVWHEGEDSGPLIEWVRQTWAAMKPFATGGVYLNSLGSDEEDERRVGEATGANMARLRDIKARYDPDNFFRLNANIEPSAR